MHLQTGLFNSLIQTGLFYSLSSCRLYADMKLKFLKVVLDSKTPDAKVSSRLLSVRRKGVDHQNFKALLLSCLLELSTHRFIVPNARHWQFQQFVEQHGKGKKINPKENPLANTAVPYILQPTSLTLSFSAQPKISQPNRKLILCSSMGSLCQCLKTKRIHWR